MEEQQYYGLEQTRGFKNYNNICWFNSAVQCLAQTPHLYNELCSCLRENENPLEIPGGTLTLNGSTIKLPQIKIEVNRPGLMTFWLCKTLRSLANEDKNSYYPFRFLQAIKLCLPQFVIGEHNDSHEFVRCLLEKLRTEKQNKYRKAIGQAIKNIKRTNPGLCADEDEAQVTKFYYFKALKKFPSPLEKYFRGTLETSLQCVQCKTVTKRKEEFFDLSVPIVELKCSNDTDVQLALDKMNEIRHIRFMHFVNFNQAQLLESKSDQSISILVYYFLLHYKMINDHTMLINNLRINGSSDSIAVENTNENEENKTDDGASLQNGREIISDCLDVKDENQIEAQISALATEPEDEMSNLDFGNINMNEEKISNSNDIPIEEEQPKLFLVTITDDSHSEGKPENKACSNDSATKEEIPETTATNNFENEIDDKQIEYVDLNGLPENGEMQSDKNKDLIPYDTQYVENYCLLETCLDNFFGKELLTDDNKVICQECSTQSGGNGEKLLRDTITQFKISSPPHILIVNLKRFNFLNGKIVKNNKRVLFPVILDMAAYCTQECDVEGGSVPLLYSLYAINEHFGTMERGHYVSYRRLETDNAEFSYINNTLPGQWIFANDENLVSIAENCVTNVKAYILFYKRIF